MGKREWAEERKSGEERERRGERGERGEREEGWRRAARGREEEGGPLDSPANFRSRCIGKRVFLRYLHVYIPKEF